MKVTSSELAFATDPMATLVRFVFNLLVINGLLSCVFISTLGQLPGCGRHQTYGDAYRAEPDALP